MIVQHIKKEEYSTTNWSGGTTSELFIYPEGANFQKGDYDLRISIATVESEQSTFTTLPDVERNLMVLKGTLRLEHEDHHSIDLNEFDQDFFKGDWKTTSFGKVTDFNVMTKNGASSNVQKVDLIAGELLTLASSYALQFVYVLHGSVQLNGTTAKEGESFAIQTVNYPKIIAEQKASIILVSVDFK